MTKNLEWNTAVEDSLIERDWKVACKSEVFSNFVKMFINKQGAFTEDDNLEEGIDLPIKQNEDYGEEDYFDKLISEAQAEMDEVEDVEEEIVDTDSDGFIDDEFGLEPVDEPFEYDNSSNEYDTGAGESKYIDIGLSDKTMNDIKNDGVMSSAVKEVMDVYKKEELAEAEKDLGLDVNAAYIFGQGRE